MPASTRDDIRRTLLELANIPGPPGFEGAIREEIHKLWRPLVDHIEVSPLGNLVGVLEGRGSEPRPCLAIVTHMDAIGFIVRRIDHGFLHVSGLGIPDPRVLLGQPVTVLGRQRLAGIMVRPPDACLSADLRDKTAPVEHLLVDLGLNDRNVSQLVRVGDLVVFDETAQALGENLVIGPALDNRASLAAVTAALASLSDKRPEWDIHVVATTQEEDSVAGAATLGFASAPDIALVVDTTFGRGPQDDEDETFAIGSAITNGLGPSLHPAVHDLLAEAAEHAQVALVAEVLPHRTSTDADVLQVAGAGIPTGLISLPIRNMHTCIEMVHLDDVVRTAKLLSAFAGTLSSATMRRIRASFTDD
jgi:putative aminopeptidase FrvX